VRRNHEKYGALRSGEGTPEEIVQKRRELEEKAYVQSLFENGELTTDPRINEKVQRLVVEDFRRRHVKNDEIDLVPHHTLFTTKEVEPPISLSAKPRALQQLQTAQG
jgi:hypothetical protein